MPARSFFTSLLSSAVYVSSFFTSPISLVSVSLLVCSVSLSLYSWSTIHHDAGIDRRDCENASLPNYRRDNLHYSFRRAHHISEICSENWKFRKLESDTVGIHARKHFRMDSICFYNWKHLRFHGQRFWTDILDIPQYRCDETPVL